MELGRPLIPHRMEPTHDKKVNLLHRSANKHRRKTQTHKGADVRPGGRLKSRRESPRAPTGSEKSPKRDHRDLQAVQGTGRSSPRPPKGSPQESKGRPKDPKSGQMDAKRAQKNATGDRGSPGRPKASPQESQRPTQGPQDRSIFENTAPAHNFRGPTPHF